jgi:hypothetical protein
LIRDARQLPDGAVVEAEVAVVGAGLAGIDIARSLVQRGMRVALLESGRLEFDPAIQELTQVSFAGKPLRTHETHGDISRYLPPMYRGYCRIRQFGGTTNVWTGKWRIFDPWDFEPCPWIPYSGWPITLDDLLPFYRETADDYGFGDFEAAASGDLFRCASGLLAPHDLQPHLFYWERAPTRSGTRFFQELKQARCIDVVLGASATELVLHDDLRTVQAVRIKTLDQKCFTLRADRFVLSTGGLEVPRLLLTSNRQIAEGIGNAHGLVGRFYMDHPKHMAGSFKPGRAMKHLIAGVETQPRRSKLCSLRHLSTSALVAESRHLRTSGTLLEPRAPPTLQSEVCHCAGTESRKPRVSGLRARCVGDPAPGGRLAFHAGRPPGCSATAANLARVPFERTGGALGIRFDTGDAGRDDGCFASHGDDAHGIGPSARSGRPRLQSLRDREPVCGKQFRLCD